MAIAATVGKEICRPFRPLREMIPLRLVFQSLLMGIGLAISCSGPADILEAEQVRPAVPETYRVASEGQVDGKWTNRLILESSPYLLQHAHNPVDWYPWGDEAFEEAQRRGVPVFLSIGYAACHWCHVMEEESFQDPELAAYLNANFVCVKVDREERPDVDALYMDAVFALNRTGGWPASIWMTPERKPFYAGSYFPKESRYGRPGFRGVLEELSTAWSMDRQTLLLRADTLVERLRTQTMISPEANFPLDAPERGFQELLQTWDSRNFGWGKRKFPMVARLEFLLDYGLEHGDHRALSMVNQALDAMDRGGIHDQLGGGFHRYTVDEQWVIPHFEKMLYDNGQLLGLYAAAAVALDEPRYAVVVDELVSYLTREMRHESGTFFSSQDADSEGEEGVFYVWTPEQIRAVLSPDDAEEILRLYQVTSQGNFEGETTVLTRAKKQPPRDTHSRSRELLLNARNKREHPATDTKRVVAYNGLVISGLARSGRLLGRAGDVALARDAAKAVLRLRREDGSFPRTFADEAPHGVLDDYAYLCIGLLDLYEADRDPSWLVAAFDVANVLMERFWDPVSGGFFYADPTNSKLLFQQKERSDGARPSGYGRALQAIARLSTYGAEGFTGEPLQEGLDAAGVHLARSPSSVPTLLGVLDGFQRPSLQVVVATPNGQPTAADPFVAVYNEAYRPHATLAVIDGRPVEQRFKAFRGKSENIERTTVYVCFDGVCKHPVYSVDAMRRGLGERGGP